MMARLTNSSPLGTPSFFIGIQNSPWHPLFLYVASQRWLATPLTWVSDGKTLLSGFLQGYPLPGASTPSSQNA